MRNSRLDVRVDALSHAMRDVLAEAIESAVAPVAKRDRMIGILRERMDVSFERMEAKLDRLLEGKPDSGGS